MHGKTAESGTLIGIYVCEWFGKVMYLFSKLSQNRPVT